MNPANKFESEEIERKKKTQHDLRYDLDLIIDAMIEQRQGWNIIINSGLSCPYCGKDGHSGKNCSKR